MKEKHVIELRGTSLVNDGMVFGRFQEHDQRLVLDLGWLDAAGVKLTVLGDPAKDRQRKVLERPKDVERLQPQGDQGRLAVDGKEPAVADV